MAMESDILRSVPFLFVDESGNLGEDQIFGVCAIKIYRTSQLEIDLEKILQSSRDRVNRSSQVKGALSSGESIGSWGPRQFEFKFSRITDESAGLYKTFLDRAVQEPGLRIEILLLPRHALSHQPRDTWADYCDRDRPRLQAKHWCSRRQRIPMARRPA